MPRTCRVTKEFRFEAAHQIPNHKGKCANLHGHSYRMEVSLIGSVVESHGRSDEGMVIDFYQVSQIVKANVVDVLDHHFLNDILPADYLPSTAENISAWIFSVLNSAFGAIGYCVDSVRVWETATSCCEYTREMYLGDN